MKRIYQKPQFAVVELLHQELLLDGSYHIDAVKSNLPTEDVFELGGENGDGDDEDYIEHGGEFR